ncbi:MAG TPA: ABC transporter permease subunit [Ktedonobacterales bacterium]|nr:ABC transporter permease subunit [Ktedonobacterales bacterium]
MTTTALTSSHQQTQIAPRLHPLLTVMAWEARRLGASRLTWILVLVAFALFLLVIGIDHGPSTFMTSYQSPDLSYAFSSNIPYLSPAWLSDQLYRSALLLLVLVLPFVCADGVARDLKRRTHELLMTTAIPSWAYVWGRFLMGLLLGLGLAVELLAAILVMGLALHLSVGGHDYPAPRVGPVLAFWAALALPAIVLVGSASFVLCTLLPRRANLVKIGVMVGWFIWAMIINARPFWKRVPDWYIHWEPTGAFLANAYDRVFAERVGTAGTGPTRSQTVLQSIFDSTRYQLPDFWSWLGPHLIWAALGLALVALVARSFKRFRNVIA